MGMKTPTIVALFDLVFVFFFGQKIRCNNRSMKIPRWIRVSYDRGARPGGGGLSVKFPKNQLFVAWNSGSCGLEGDTTTLTDYEFLWLQKIEEFFFKETFDAFDSVHS